MVKYFYQGDTLLWVILQELFYQVFIVLFTLRAETDLAFANFLRDLNWVLTSKGSVPVIKLIQKDA